MLKRNAKLIALVFCFVMILSIIALAVYEPFKVKLNLYERVVIMSLLPKEGNFVTLKIIRDLQGVLAPTEEEIKLTGLKTDVDTGGIMADNWLAIPEKEITFGDIAKGLIVDALKKLDETQKLTNDHFTVYEKFIMISDKKEG